MNWFLPPPGEGPFKTKNMKDTKAYIPPTVELLELRTESTIATLSYNEENFTEYFGFDSEYTL